MQIYVTYLECQTREIKSNSSINHSRTIGGQGGGGAKRNGLPHSLQENKFEGAAYLSKIKLSNWQKKPRRDH